MVTLQKRQGRLRQQTLLIITIILHSRSGVEKRNVGTITSLVVFRTVAHQFQPSRKLLRIFHVRVSEDNVNDICWCRDFSKFLNDTLVEVFRILWAWKSADGYVGMIEACWSNNRTDMQSNCYIVARINVRGTSNTKVFKLRKRVEWDMFYDPFDQIAELRNMPFKTYRNLSNCTPPAPKSVG